MFPVVLVLFLVLMVLALPAAYGLGRSSVLVPPDRAGEIAERDRFIGRLRDLAEQHRETSPELAALVIDEVDHRRAVEGERPESFGPFSDPRTWGPDGPEGPTA
ncbi:hypothetical protein [Nocardioides zeicaulis]|uniref:C-type cytochrome biogenesis protein CcmI n=1 Tax=Nocardioides zeicaulis TaxID=1776857 RepID=A0ABV6DZ17_9ACTN